MKSVDYGWIWAIVIVVGLAVFWKPLLGGISNITGGTKRKESIAAGKVIFYDTNRWGGKGVMSCAMCHASDFKPEEGKVLAKMPDYKPGQPYVLNNIKDKYGSVMTGDDALLEQINNCLGQPSRMNVGKVSAAAPFLKDLTTYLKSL